MTEAKSEADKMLERIQRRDEENRRAGIVPEPIDPEPRETTRIIINGVPRELHAELQALAFRSKSSLSRLGLLAVEQLLIRARQGALPLLPPADFESAIEVGAMGIPTGN